MAPKRKSDAFDSAPLIELPVNGKKLVQTTLEHPAKKSRVDDASDATGSSSKSTDALKSGKPTSWKDITLEGEDEGEVPIFDDCGEVRRKIRLLQKTPGWKVTQWLKDIGGINSNSYGRFMREKGKNDGQSNGTYYAAYVYFEKVRIFENKKKSAKRLETERIFGEGHSRERARSRVWVFGA